MPNGDTSEINEAGFAYYDKVINRCLENDLDVMITMYHYDIPQSLDEYGGLQNSSMIEHFKNYADLLFDRYGNRVKHWITFNEPYIFCLSLYGGGGTFIESINGVREYKCSENVLKAHATVYRLYEKKYKSKPKFIGKVGISLNTDFFYGNKEDTDRAIQFKVIYLLFKFCFKICIRLMSCLFFF